MTETVNQILAYFTLAGHIFLAAVLVSLLFSQSRKFVVTKIGQHGLALAFLVVLGSTAASLYYSNIVGFPPCDLCWYQRIFMYPQVILLGLAWHRKDYKIVDYGLVLAGIGTLISLYHNWIYYGGQSILPCEAFGLGVSCTKRYVFELGYVTIPLMALTGFALTILFLSLQKYYNRQV